MSKNPKHTKKKFPFLLALFAGTIALCVLIPFLSGCGAIKGAIRADWEYTNQVWEVDR